MYYQPKHLAQLDQELALVTANYAERLMKLVKVDGKIKNDSAREYLQHGVMRRLKILNRAVLKIFTIYHHRREHQLSDDELAELCIVLHAFYGNIYGLTDNIAWVLNYEKNLQFERREVGLYSKKFKKSLNREFRAYLVCRYEWYHKHLKEFRDSISHRIPLYIPPFAQAESGKVISPAPFYSGSILTGSTMLLHVQVLADMNTVNELIDKFVQFEFPEQNQPTEPIEIEDKQQA